MRTLGHAFSRLLAALALAAPLFSCTATLNGPAPRKADEISVIPIDQSRAHLYEHRHLDYVQFNSIGITTEKDWDANFVEPLDYEETKQGRNGETTLGELVVKGYGLGDMGYRTPVNFFDYSAFSVYTDVSMEFTFKSKSTDTYNLFHCKDNRLDGASLGGEIGAGSVIALKRYKNSSEWVKAKEWLNIPSGTTCIYDVPGPDILKGVYVRFVAAYQTRNLETSTILYKNYRFYDYMQRENVFLSKSGTALNIQSASTPNQTHALTDAGYEQTDYEGTLALDAAHKASKLSLGGFSNLADFTLEGEIIQAIVAESGIEPEVPMFAYNGTSGSIQLHLENRTRLVSSMYARQNDTASTSIHSTHVNGDKIVETDAKLAPFGQGSLLLQGLSKNDNGYLWTTFQTESNVVTDNATISFEVSKAITYILLRAIYVTSFKYDALLVESAVTYFQVFDYSGTSESSFTKYKGIYSVEEGYNSELAAFAAGATLGDGSVSFSAIKVTKIEGNEVEYAYNGDAYVPMTETTMMFVKEGKYRFKVTNDFGETSYRTIYLLDIGQDNGKSRYFSKYGTFLDQSKRVYAPDSGVPCYGPDVDFSLSASPYWPSLSITIMRISKGGEAETLQSVSDLHQDFTGTFHELGQYRVVIDTSDPTSSGDHIRYTISFNVVDSSSYTPVVNYDLLHSGIFSSSFASKDYLVKCPTLGKGNLYFVYPYTVEGHNDALTLAIELEYQNVETLENGTFRYPAKTGQTYEDKFDLYDALKTVAKTRVESAFLDANLFANEDEVSYRIEDIATLDLDEDIYVVKDESVFKSLVRDPVYINGYAFVSLREYECSSVQLVSPSGKLIDVPFDTVVDALLEESGIYEVIETNWCGQTRYQVAYAHEGHVGTVFKLRYIDGEGNYDSAIREYGYTPEIRAKSVCFADIFDNYDPYSYVNVVCGEESITLLPEDLKGRVLDADGAYDIYAQNRLGNRYVYRITIQGGSGSSRLPHYDPENPLTYTTIGGI